MSEIIGTQTMYLSPSTQVVNAENDSVTFTYNGLYDLLRSRLPQKDTVWNEGQMYTVLSASVMYHPGGMGEMSVTCIPYKVSTSAGEPTSEHFEIQFIETSLQLAFHPEFPRSSLDEWQLFLISPDAVKYKGEYCPDPADTSLTKRLPGDLSEWASLYCKGIEDYVVYLPVVMRVRTYNLSPEREVSNVGRLESPDVVPNGYDGGRHWLKTGDSFIQEPGSGKWTRTETWTYAEEWPSLLYK